MTARPPLHQPALHESGYRHASGQALYVDDLPPPHGMLVAQVLSSSQARAKIRRLDVSAARSLPGVHAILTAEDVPGTNDVSAFAHDEPLLATGEVFCIGQSIALVVAEDYESARGAIAHIEIEYESLPATLTLEHAIAEQSFLTTPHVIARGDVDTALASAPHRIETTVRTGGQDHFYLETHAALAIPVEDGAYYVHSSTQHPSEVQAKIAEVLGLASRQVVVETARMGGGFGGKETQAAHFAALAALGAHHVRRPVKVWLNRDQDMTTTGKRHPCHSTVEAGFDDDGHLLALRVDITTDGGWSQDLSQPIIDRALFHLDNAYYIEHLRFTGRVARTNNPSNTAFRGFGGPQGMVVVEQVMSEIAERLGLDPAEVRRRNYYGAAPRNTTPYGQEVRDNRIDRIHTELLEKSEYVARRKAIDEFNQSHRYAKRGIGFQPVKFGISFTNSMLNQAGALVNIYADGSVQVSHGGTEMGQGLHTKMLAIAAHELGVPESQIRLMNTVTDKVPNTSATAASSGSDLNGQAIKQACETLLDRLRPVAAELLGLEPSRASELRFEAGSVFTDRDGKRARFSEVTRAAYAAQISMSSTGYYRTPGIFYDPKKGRGKPFHYFAYGAAVVEVEVNRLSGEHRALRVDILHDVGDSLVPTIDRGQIEGGFIQGLGWLTCEELVFSEHGELRTHSPDTYKIPAIGEAPPDLRVDLLQHAPQLDVIHGSKAVGEPPFMLAIAVVSALRQAVFAFSPEAEHIDLRIPCTPEAVLRAIEGATET